MMRSSSLSCALGSCTSASSTTASCFATPNTIKNTNYSLSRSNIQQQARRRDGYNSDNHHHQSKSTRSGRGKVFSQSFRSSPLFPSPSFSCSRRSTPKSSPVVARSSSKDDKREEREVDSDVVEFGYSRKDVILLCTLPLLGGYATYYGLQKFLGLNPIQAGNYVQVIFVFVLCVGWCATYLFRVGTKNMTYTQQLKDYEEAVMEKRLEEMSDSEIQEILDQSNRESKQ